MPREFTGEVDVLAGTPIPWSTSVPVTVGVGARGKVHVHLMEGPDRVSSYEIDLFIPTGSAGGVIGGRGGGKGPDLEATLKIFFLVDDGGVPSVQSARCVTWVDAGGGGGCRTRCKNYYAETCTFGT